MSADLRLMSLAKARDWLEQEVRSLSDEKCRLGFSMEKWEARAAEIEETYVDYIDTRMQMLKDGYLEWEEDN